MSGHHLDAHLVSQAARRVSTTGHSRIPQTNKPALQGLHLHDFVGPAPNCSVIRRLIGPLPLGAGFLFSAASAN